MGGSGRLDTPPRNTSQCSFAELEPDLTLVSPMPRRSTEMDQQARRPLRKKKKNSSPYRFASPQKTISAFTLSLNQHPIDTDAQFAVTLAPTPTLPLCFQRDASGALLCFQREFT
ncbi:Hypothetical predicted protein [Cloeon dipterum]|uniref:Uncharacterized protein n=1 Tax=Cloeon dipterum TaxID=197152 RepID=A0A8S1CUM3_9INSE|nr:Hypothetical predicted protein [Cloeon dipterum]